MKSLLAFLAASLLLLFPALARAQNTGRIECARGDGYIYLYSSMTTLDVRTTLQCGEIVQITGRYETYCAVRTAKGEVGYVPLASNTSAEAVLPLATGKDAAILEDAEFTALVDTDIQLKREAFAAPTAPNDSTAPAVSHSPQSR